MFTIRKRFEFSASHQLHNLPAGHQCARLHGHNYVIEVELAKHNVNQIGFVRDYGELRFVKDFIDQELDHRHLNDVVQFQPTAECLAEWLFHQFFQAFPELVAVSVSETSKTWAEFRRDLKAKPEPVNPEPVKAAEVTFIPRMTPEQIQLMAKQIAEDLRVQKGLL